MTATPNSQFDNLSVPPIVHPAARAASESFLAAGIMPNQLTERERQVIQFYLSALSVKLPGLARVSHRWMPISISVWLVPFPSIG
jgi:hypothetical protein